MTTTVVLLSPGVVVSTGVLYSNVVPLGRSPTLPIDFLGSGVSPTLTVWSLGVGVFLSASVCLALISIGTLMVSVVPSGYVTSIGTLTKPLVALSAILLVMDPESSSTDTDSTPVGSVPALKLVPAGTATTFPSTSRTIGI